MRVPSRPRAARRPDARWLEQMQRSRTRAHAPAPSQRDLYTWSNSRPGPRRCATTGTTRKIPSPDAPPVAAGVPGAAAGAPGNDQRYAEPRRGRDDCRYHHARERPRTRRRHARANAPGRPAVPADPAAVATGQDPSATWCGFISCSPRPSSEAAPESRIAQLRDDRNPEGLQEPGKGLIDQCIATHPVGDDAQPVVIATHLGDQQQILDAARARVDVDIRAGQHGTRRSSCRHCPAPAPASRVRRLRPCVDTMTRPVPSGVRS